MTLKVSYDAGHGIYTSGKRTPADEREWAFNDKVAKAFATEMKKYQGVAIKRFDDPTGKTDISLKTRTNGANSWGSDIHISFHHNANTGKWGNWTGTEVHVYKSKPTESTKLAKLVHQPLAKAYGLKDRGIKFTNLHITREIKGTAILIEGGFMDSNIDIKKLRSNAVLKKAGQEVARAVAKYAGLKKNTTKSKTKPNTPSTISGKTYKVKKGDTLWAISKSSGVSVAKLKEYNGLKSNTIQTGLVLTLVPKSKSTSKPKSTGIKKIGTVKMTGVNNFTYIYASTSDKSTKLGKAYKNKTFSIAGSVPGWWEVIYNGKRAYIKSKYASRT